MAGLAHIIEDFDRRMATRRRMLAHLDIDVPQPRCAEFREHLRHTLLSCARCPRPDDCTGWMDQGRLGAPLFCRARESFLVLQDATRDPAPRTDGA